MPSESGANRDSRGQNLLALRFENHARGLRVRYDTEVRPPLWLTFEVSMVGARPLALSYSALHRRYHTSGSTPAAPVVVAAWNTSGNGRLYEIRRGLERW